jgi:hypothetical protein
MKLILSFPQYDDEDKRVTALANTSNLKVVVCDLPPQHSTEAGSQRIQSVCRQGSLLPVIALKESTARRENLSPLARRRKASKPGIT